MEEKKRDWKKYYNPSVQNKANTKYRQSHMQTVTITFNKDTEPDLVEKINSVKSKATYIKSLIRSDINK